MLSDLEKQLENAASKPKRKYHKYKVEFMLSEEQERELKRITDNINAAKVLPQALKPADTLAHIMQIGQRAFLDAKLKEFRDYNGEQE